MKTAFVAAAFGVVCVGALWSQSAVWLPQGATSGNIYYSGGNVGIGTTTPASALHVDAGTTNGNNLTVASTANNTSINLLNNQGTPHTWRLLQGGGGAGLLFPNKFAIDQNDAVFRLVIDTSGNVGIGTTNPTKTLDVNGPMGFVYGTTISQNDYFNTGAAGSLANAIGSTLIFRRNYDNIPLMTIQGSGNVGIGTTAPCTNSFAPAGCKLSVAGAIQAQEIVVNTGWSDYVFRPQYRLRPLTEVAAYIKENGHLPDIPSEAEVKEKGIGVGEMEAKLLAKIEELTLHMIESDRANTELRDEVRHLREENREIRDRIGGRN